MNKIAKKRGSSEQPNQRYHHGTLRRAILDAAIALIEEAGPNGVTMREASRRANVSSAAPFRHFSSKQALMTAIAEEGINYLRDLVGQELEALTSPHPIHQLMAFARAYVCWFCNFPVHFRVVADRPRIDFEGSKELVETTHWIRTEMSKIYVQAHDIGLFVNPDPEALHLQMRALSYGLGRMYVDEHLREWSIKQTDAQEKMLNVLRENLISHCTNPKAARDLLSNLPKHAEN